MAISDTDAPRRKDTHEMLDCSEMTYAQMADIVRAIRNEVKERNPIFVNFYIQGINTAIDVLEEISEGEDRKEVMHTQEN